MDTPVNEYWDSKQEKCAPGARTRKCRLQADTAGNELR